MMVAGDLPRSRGSKMKTTESLMDQTALPQVLSTGEAAAAINRRPQTLRKWACLENGPLRPVRIHGRLAWLVKDIRSLIEQR